jgi:hypothetical protein
MLANSFNCEPIDGLAGHYANIRRLSSHARSRSRSGLQLVHVLLKVSFWYTDLLEIPILHRGLKPHKLMLKMGLPDPCAEVAGRLRLTLEPLLAATW